MLHLVLYLSLRTGQVGFFFTHLKELGRPLKQLLLFSGWPSSTNCEGEMLRRHQAARQRPVRRTQNWIGGDWGALKTRSMWALAGLGFWKTLPPRENSLWFKSQPQPQPDIAVINKFVGLWLILSEMYSWLLTSVPPMPTQMVGTWLRWSMTFLWIVIC